MPGPTDGIKKGSKHKQVTQPAVPGFRPLACSIGFYHFSIRQVIDIETKNTCKETKKGYATDQDVFSHSHSIHETPGMGIGEKSAEGCFPVVNSCCQSATPGFYVQPDMIGWVNSYLVNRQQHIRFFIFLRKLFY